MRERSVRADHGRRAPVLSQREAQDWTVASGTRPPQAPDTAQVAPAPQGAVRGKPAGRSGRGAGAGSGPGEEGGGSARGGLENSLGINLLITGECCPLAWNALPYSFWENSCLSLKTSPPCSLPHQLPLLIHQTLSIYFVPGSKLGARNSWTKCTAPPGFTTPILCIGSVPS